MHLQCAHLREVPRGAWFCPRCAAPVAADQPTSRRKLFPSDEECPAAKRSKTAASTASKSVPGRRGSASARGHSAPTDRQEADRLDVDEDVPVDPPARSAGMDWRRLVWAKLLSDASAKCPGDSSLPKVLSFVENFGCRLTKQEPAELSGMVTKFHTGSPIPAAPLNRADVVVVTAPAQGSLKPAIFKKQPQSSPLHLLGLPDPLPAALFSESGYSCTSNATAACMLLMQPAIAGRALNEGTRLQVLHDILLLGSCLHLVGARTRPGQFAGPACVRNVIRAGFDVSEDDHDIRPSLLRHIPKSSWSQVSPTTEPYKTLLRYTAVKKQWAYLVQVSVYTFALVHVSDPKEVWFLVETHQKSDFFEHPSTSHLWVTSTLRDLACLLGSFLALLGGRTTRSRFSAIMPAVDAECPVTRVCRDVAPHLDSSSKIQGLRRRLLGLAPP
eukprot:NODE_97_length_2829_cov_21.793525_g74_i0.p1 GENE.NODE_97_length_2829_cov_21.793525_g74_i0~~NODE_97_length_2829_cov_21.793525_g74_i0.p1  ORF type:complete len:443 (-),score=66.47 NODE_97_length_2829_cov_21.793525_g74_i0:110-1438(-)